RSIESRISCRQRPWRGGVRRPILSRDLSQKPFLGSSQRLSQDFARIPWRGCVRRPILSRDLSQKPFLGSSQRLSQCLARTPSRGSIQSPSPDIAYRQTLSPDSVTVSSGL